MTPSYNVKMNEIISNNVEMKLYLGLHIFNFILMGLL